MNRRAFLKRFFGGALTLLGLSGGTYYYARDIEPGLLSIQQETIKGTNIPQSFNDFTILQFSDTHIGFHYDLDQFEELTKQINQLKPDLIVFTGDLVDEPNQYSWDNRLTDLLGTLNAPYGKYWVYGNHDHGGYGTETIKKVMHSAGFNLLQNSHQAIEINQDRIILAGIDDVMLGRPDLTKTIENTNPELFTILLAHEPDFADITVQYPIEVQLSGHSHGGQVRLPFVGHLYTPIYAEKYVEGKYTFESSNLNLYVSRGIGTTRLPYRFLCKPEIHLFTLKS
ncbi:metallophosphoesterase [Ornithinibacillus xuwenensis]|uniref:Metallophosphoesterase n=1 Tax=Ornithinibacillus xuwenensis TaxID=3144668 RepID=A0ABU9XEB1_9BACI